MFPLTDPVLVFTILALCILSAPIFSRHLRVPDLVLLLGCGVLLGPHGFHVLERTTAITLLGAVGMIYIMFLAGIEIDLYRFTRTYKRSIAFGLLTFVIPMILGTLAGRYVLSMNWRTSLLLASMFASHTLLAYPLASRLGISRSEPVAVTVGATVITDTLALLVLAVIADSTRGIALSPGFWATIVVGMLALTTLIWKGIPYISRWFFHRFTEESNAQFLFVIVIVCGFAYLSHFARMEPIIGAFLAGAAFNRLIPENSPLMSRLTFAGHTLFIPFFLISVGMLVDVRAMITDLRSWFVGATMVFMVILTKYLAAQVARRAFRYSRSSAQVMFGLSVVQAAATLAAVMIGHELAIFDDAVLNGAIVMIAVTCPLGSWIVDRYGRRLALEAPAKPEAATALQRLLVSVANSETAIRLLDMAFLLHNNASQGGIHPLTIVRDSSDTDDSVAKGEKLLADCLAHAASADIPLNPSLRIAVNVSDGIVHAAREMRASSVILGWPSKHSTSIRIFGTVSQRMIENCASRLLFCRLVRPLNTSNRLLALFPPLASRRRDVTALIRDAKVLAHRIGMELLIYTVSDEAEALRQMAHHAKPNCPLRIEHTLTWDTTLEQYAADIGPDDMLLLPLDRRTGLMWTPAIDRLPEWIASRFPDANLLVAYPSLPSPEQAFADESVDQDADAPTLLPFDLRPDTPLEHALQHLVKIAFASSPDTAPNAMKRLLDSARNYPVELATGTVLLHAQCGNLEKAQLMVCHAPGGLTMPGLPTPARIILILLGAEAPLPDPHLRALSYIAQWVRRAEQKSWLSSAHNAAELCALLKEE